MEHSNNYLNVQENKYFYNSFSKCIKKTVVIHNTSLTKALLSKSNSVVSNSWLSQYIARMQMNLGDYQFDSIITKKEIWCKGGGSFYTLSKTFAWNHQSPADETRCGVLIF